MRQETQTNAAPENNGKPARNTTLRVLTIFSLVYLGGLAFFFFQTAPCVPDWWGPQNPPEGFVDTFIRCRTSNEVGDFLAGAFAPLAFLWLAGAVLIQSKELKAQKEELTLTRSEMAAMREVATAQAAEARASKEFIGKQTEIMQRQLEREQLDDLHDEFEARIKTLAACLDRFYIEWSYVDENGRNYENRVRTPNAGDLDHKVRNLLSDVTKLSRTITSLRSRKLVDQIPGYVDNAEQLLGAANDLRDIRPRLGQRSRARFEELALEDVLSFINGIFDTLGAAGFGVPELNYTGTPD